ncbi:MAG: transposase, partial [Hyphomicrobium sp.]|nr:transposase [Hyphomicrobium sp.]
MQTLYNLSDEETEFQINDRMTFMRFIGKGLEGRIPDATTLWLFRERLASAGLI